MRIDTENAAFPPSGGSGAIGVSTNRECQWTARSEAPWVSLSASEGQGEGTVQFSVAANADPSGRSTAIIVNDQRAQIAQDAQPCEFSVSSNREAVDATGGERTVQVRTSASQCAWTASANESWITIVSGGEGRGDGSVRFRVDAVSGISRSGTLSIAGLTVHVEQGAGCTYSIGTGTFSVAASGGDRQVALSTEPGCPWSAKSSIAWITITSGITGSGPGIVAFRVAATDGPARAGSVIIAGQTVAIAQASGCTYSLSPAGQRIRASGGPASTSVSTATGCTWSATSALSWITISMPSGSGPGEATFGVTRNQGPPRTGMLTIAGQVHTVTQESECTWSFNPPSHEVAAAGGFGTVLVFVTGPCTWTATSDVDWIRVVAGASGAGGGLFQFTIAENTGPARTGIILVGGDKYLVNQGGR